MRTQESMRALWRHLFVRRLCHRDRRVEAHPNPHRSVDLRISYLQGQTRTRHDLGNPNGLDLSVLWSMSHMLDTTTGFRRTTMDD